MELAANMLSPSSKPMVVCRSATSIEAFPPGGAYNREWINHAIAGRGQFTVDADRLQLAPHLERLISTRKSQALAEGDLEFFRVLHARTARLLDGTGIVPPEESYSEWMATMRFESINDGKSSKSGLSPLYFAVMAGRKDIVAALLERGANLKAVPKINLPKYALRKGINILGAACSLTDDTELVQMLMQHGLDPRAEVEPMEGDHALGVSIAQSNCKVIQFLIQHDRSLLDLRQRNGTLPLAYAIGFGKLEALLLIKEHYPEALKESAKEPAACWGNDYVGFAVANNAGNLEVLKICMDAGFSPNTTGPGFGKLGTIFHVCDFVRRFSKLKLGFLTMMAYGSRVPAMSSAAMAGNIAAVKLLLDHGADVNGVGHNPRKWTALHWASFAGHGDAVTVLLGAGARADVKDSAGRTPADLAKRVGNNEIRQMLIGSALEARNSRETAPWSKGKATHQVAPE